MAGGGKVTLGEGESNLRINTLILNETNKSYRHSYPKSYP